jgi:hypothetical protein
MHVEHNEQGLNAEDVCKIHDSPNESKLILAIIILKMPIMDLRVVRTTPLRVVVNIWIPRCVLASNMYVPSDKNM